MKLTKDNDVYKSFNKLKEIEEKADNAENSKEKIYWRGEYLKKDREFFEQLKRSEFKNESALTVLRKLKELYSSEKKSKSSLTTALFICRTDGH